MKNRLLPLLFVLFLYGVAYGQNANERSIRFSLFAWDQSISELHYSAQGDDQAVNIPNGAPTQPFSYKGASPLNFYTLHPAEDGTVVRKIRASVELNAGIDDWLLVFVPSRGAGDVQYRILAVPDDQSGARANSFLFFNYMESDLAVRVDDSRELLPRGSFKVFEASEAGGKNVTVQLASADESGWDLIYQSKWGHPRDRKVWAFLFTDENGRTKVKKFYQRAR
jgi:hypothetical protein